MSVRVRFAPVPDRPAPRRRPPNGPLQRPARPQDRRHVRAPHRGHGPGALRRGRRGGHPGLASRGPASRPTKARARGSRRRPARAVPPVRAHRPLPRRRARAARRRPRLRRLRHARGARRDARARRGLRRRDADADGQRPHGRRLPGAHRRRRAARRAAEGRARTDASRSPTSSAATSRSRRTAWTMRSSSSPTACRRTTSPTSSTTRRWRSRTSSAARSGCRPYPSTCCSTTRSGSAPPQMAHLPLILAPSGGKLSKRNADKAGIPVSVRDYRAAGYEPEALVNFLGLLGWNDGTDRERFTLAEMADAFSVERIHKAGAKFDLDKLNWLNAQTLRDLPADAIAERARPAVEAAVGPVDAARLAAAADLMRERIVVRARPRRLAVPLRGPRDVRRGRASRSAGRTDSAPPSWRSTRTASTRSTRSRSRRPRRRCASWPRPRASGSGRSSTRRASR